jgi:PEGA domain
MPKLPALGTPYRAFLALSVGTLLSSLLLGAQIQSAGGASAPADQPCVILKRMGPADQVTSHLYSFGFRGKQFEYVGGKLPEGVKFHGRLTDHDVRNIQDAGGRIEIIDAHYTEAELSQARKNCGLAASNNPAPAASPIPAGQAAQKIGSAVLLRSVPDGADINVDSKYMGSTPSTIHLAPGDHNVSVEKSGFKAWQRTVTVTNGSDITVDATLEKQEDASTGAAQATPNPSALSLQDIVGLLGNHVASARVSELVGQYGLKFSPSEADLEKIRKAGGDDNLIETIRRVATAHP